ncbi:hypothetical protein GGR42_001926 [Saonia flava]|uniref:Putative auto-transporter adhesin head GIN domain-containing protein n=1 Tax=Saonia flava TaxID=523696 RepID=A0A846R256_9FLAO|nr:head GIN domain-containing protein [Saonia flava]NJB71464.1 hypothetical protein [Saonia flava]
MKRIVLLVFICVGIYSGTAQKEEIIQSLDKFTEVKGFDGLSINLIKSNENRAVITGANTQKVAIVNNQGVLKIRMEINKLFSGYRTFIDLYYTETLTVIDVNEDAKIILKEKITQDILELRAQEGGELHINAEVEQILVKAVTGGVITTKGTSKLQDVNINTGGVYNGKELKTEYSTISVNAGSNASIFATDYVKATVKAGGEVLVYGNPTKMDEKTIFGGKVTRM